jgi:hypothetical protein
MLRTPLAARSKDSKCEKLAFAVFIALACCLVHPASTAYASKKKKKTATYGMIKILTTPGSFPIEIDGKPQGETTSDYREFELDPGLHTVVISLPSGQKWTRAINVDAGRRKCLALNYRPPTAQPKSPCPYPVNVSAAASVNEGDVITFTADVAYSGTAALNYTWTISPGDAKVVSGAGTPTMGVDSTGSGGRRITATLVVDDGSGDPTCRPVSQASTMVQPPPPPHESPAREFDVCCTCSYDDQKARLDNLAIAMQNEPSTSSYIIAYAGRTSHVGQADRLLTRARDYLIKQRGVDQSRIVTVNGGFREEDCVELWLVPSGAQPPQPTPTVQAGEARPAREKPVKKNRRG